MPKDIAGNELQVGDIVEVVDTRDRYALRRGDRFVITAIEHSLGYVWSGPTAKFETGECYDRTWVRKVKPEPSHRVVRNTEIFVYCREDDGHDKIHWYATSGEVGLSVNGQCVPFSAADAECVLEGLQTLVNELNKE